MNRFTMMLALVVGLPVLAWAQEIDLGGNVSGYTRFLVYPHLEKGWESVQRGDRDRALAELERARSLAPDNATVALYLAKAYQRFGQIGRAESVLRDQLTRTPDDDRLRTALAELRAAAQPLAAVPRASSCPDAACRDTSVPDGKRDSAAPSTALQPDNTVRTANSTPITERARRPVRLPDESPNGGAPADPITALRARFTFALEARRFDDAQRHAQSLVGHEARAAAVLDELTYRLLDAGATEQATRVLLGAYPFAGHTPAEREMLLQRLTHLIEQQRNTLNAAQLLPLREPLDTPTLRSRQGVLWATLQDCGAVRGVLKDISGEYGHDDWMRLGDCSTGEDPKGALQAYSRAHALEPGGRASRALAYQAYAIGDYAAALGAWRSVDADRLSADELLAAVTTALAAGDNDQAANWVRAYREAGKALNHRYWSLAAQTFAPRDTAAAVAALERAIELHPELDDYLRLARLERDFKRQVQWLERAAELDGDRADVYLELGYAYARAGRPDSALLALEHAAALDPDNMNVQVELGYAYWRAGLAASAQHALERAWRADPGNLELTEQLVYVHQRLSLNEEARRYARRVLDTPSSSNEMTAKDLVESADRRFGLQRLHEDLGRRVRLSLDGWSGTRVGTGTGASQAGNRYNSYSQFEVDVRLGNPPIRDGSTLSAYARVLADGGDRRSPVPSQNAMLGLGLRWKPWRSQVIYLAAENQNGLDNQNRRDVLVRASASFLNGRRHSDDWHPLRDGWFSRNIYIDAAHYLKRKDSAFTTDYRTSYHRRISTGQTLEPYWHVQFNVSRNVRFERDIRTGFGVRWNVWHGATRYDAAPHKVSVGVEFQQAFETYLSDRNGLFLTVGTRW